MKKPRPLVSRDFVCSLHFEEDDYIPDEENFDSRGRKRTKPKLKPFAFPRINLIRNSNEVKSASKRAHNYQTTELDDFVEFNYEQSVKKASKMEMVEDDELAQEELEFNPWSGDSLEQFLYYCCPECEDRCQIPDDFVEHALTYHPKAAIFLKQFTLKEEPIVYQDYDNDDTEMNNDDESFSALNSVKAIKLEKDVVHDDDNTTVNPDEETLSYENENSDNMMTYDEVPIKSEFQANEDPLETSDDIVKNQLVQVNRQQSKLGKKKNGQEAGILKKKSKIKQNKLKKSVTLDNNDEKDDDEEDSIQQPNFCKSCEIQYTNRAEYQTHYFMQHYIPGQWTNSKHGQNKVFSFTCDHCSFTGRLGFMYQHYLDKHPDETYILTCTECNFQVPVVGGKACWPELRKYFYHVKKHKATPDYMCSFCAKTFIRSHGLKRHMKHSHSETSKKDLVCELCGYKTHLVDFLKKHYIHQHDESRKKQCPHCEYNNTIYQHLLEVHIDNNHPETGKPAFFCSTCKKGFIYPYSAKYCERKHQDVSSSFPYLFHNWD